MTQVVGREEAVPELVRRLGEALVGRGWTLAVAESCTGGSLGAAITDRAGSSAFFLGGIVAYDNRLKCDLLGVTGSDLDRHGAVSLVVAERMAAGCRKRLGASLAISVTGIAGPGGATAEKPVGLVFIGVATESGECAEEFHFAGDRGAVRAQAVATALKLALRAAAS